MKKIILISAVSVAFLFVSSIVTVLLKSFPIINPLHLIFIGVGILVLSGIIAIFAKKNFIINSLCILISAVALGFCIRGWYVYREFDNSLLTMFAVSLACVVYLWLFLGLSRIPFIQKHFTLFTFLYLTVSLISYILLVIFTKTTFISTLGYYAIIEIAFIFALCVDDTDLRTLLRNVTISTYSVFVVAVILILIIVGGDGDFTFNDFSSSIDSPTGKRKHKNIEEIIKQKNIYNK